LNSIEYRLVECNQIMKIQLQKKYVNLSFHVIHVIRIEVKVDFQKQLKTIQGSHAYNNLIDHIKHYCCRVSKHKLTQQNPILFFVCLLQ
jgi:hypothetical protein